MQGLTESSVVQGEPNVFVYTETYACNIPADVHSLYGIIESEGANTLMYVVYLLRVAIHRKYECPRSRPHLIDHIFGARITLTPLFARLFYKVDP